MNKKELTAIKKDGVEIDYKPGDWVETCDMLPGIVEKIIPRLDEVRIFYPHHALKYPGEYNGGSICSIQCCGVHKITPEYACKLFSIGEEKLKKLWEEMEQTNTYDWEERVEKCYNELYGKER